MQSRGKIKRKKYSITFKKIKPVPKPIKKQKSTMRNLVYNLTKRIDELEANLHRDNEHLATSLIKRMKSLAQFFF